MNALNFNVLKSAFTKVVTKNILSTRYSTAIINNMSKRPYDFCVYGASGFTGQYVAAEAFRTRGDKKIAIAGRNKAKLEKVLDFMKEQNGGEEVHSEVGIIIANNSNNDTILEMCRQSQVIINCVGPYAYYGEQIVKACIEMGAHHVDISGESKYIQACQLEYHEKAKEKGLHIVSTCGFDSIPADIGVETLRERFPGELVSAESYIHVGGGGGINVGTYNSLVQALQDKDIVKQQVKDIFKGRLPYLVPKPKKKFGWSESEKKYFIPFLGPDGSVVNRTQLYELTNYNKTPINYTPFFTIPNLVVFFFYMLFGLNLFIMSKFQLGMKLLLRYPWLFTFGRVSDGVSHDDIKKRGFKIVIYGKGYKNKPVDSTNLGKPDTEMTLTLRGPDPGYVFTSMTLVAAAHTILDDKLLNYGGVLTPGSAFKGTRFVERIEKRGVQISTTAP